MIEGYFPHRELGICLFEQGKAEDALSELQISMGMEPSARAKFYINRIQKQLADAAAPPPLIQLPAIPRWTNLRKISIAGAVLCSNAVASVTIDNEPEFIEIATPQINFTRKLTLHEGENIIRIEANGLNGKQSVTNITITADWTAPQIAIQRTTSTAALSCRDNIELARVLLNGQAIPVANNYIESPLTTTQPLQFSAIDRAGNRIEWALSEKELYHLAQNQPPAPPALKVNGAGITTTLCVPEYALDLRAEDDTALQSVKLNGKELLAQSSPLFRALHRINLSSGTNQLTVGAEDGDGNRTEQTVKVVYRPPEHMDRIYRLAAATEPLSGEIPNPEFEQSVFSQIQHELTLDPVRFYLLASENEEQIIHKELELSNGTWADPRAALKRSKKLSTDLTMIPRVLSDGKGQTVYIEVLDTQNGKQLFIEDVYLETPDQLPHQIAGLIMKTEQHFPLIQAQLHQKNGHLQINAGEENGIQKGMRFIVIRSSGTFREGRVLRRKDGPAEVIASEIESKVSTVIIPLKQSKESAHPGDYVFSR